MKKLNQKGFGIVEGLLIFVVVVLIGGAGFYVYRSNKDNPESAKSDGRQTQKQPADSTKPDKYAGWKTYTHPTLKYSFKYPANWTITREPKPEGIAGLYDTEKVQSPDFKEKADAYGGTVSGADISVGAQTLTLEEKNMNVNDYIEGKILYTSQQKAVKVDGQRAAQYVLSYEGPSDLFTLAIKDNRKYEFIYQDVKNPDYEKYLQTYKDLVSSFRFN